MDARFVSATARDRHGHAQIARDAGTAGRHEQRAAAGEIERSGVDVDIAGVVSQYPPGVPGGTVNVTLARGPLTSAIQQPVTFSAKGAAAAGDLKLTLQLKTGLVTGSFIPGGSASGFDTHRHRIYGVFFPGAGKFGGLFPGDPLSLGEPFTGDFSAQ